MSKSPQPQRILTVIEGREENRRIVEGFRTEAVKRGWGLHALAGINSDKIARFDFADIPLDFVIFREMSKNNYYEVERVLEWLKTNHKIGINLNVRGGRTSTSDKHYQQGLFLLDPVLKNYALPTFEAKSKSNVLSYVEWNRVRYPFVLKPRRGTTGDDIFLIEKREDLDKIETFHDFLIEQYIEPDCDWRVFVIGGTAVGAMRKTGNPNKPNDFKAWCAGYKKESETDEKILAKIGELACHAAAVSGLEYAGIDIIRAKDTGRYYLLETNIAASWSNFVPTTKINIPSLVLDWIEERANMNLKPKREVVKTYIESRKKYLPESIREAYEAILRGESNAPEFASDFFNQTGNYYLTDSVFLFNKLKSAYLEVLNSTPGALEKAGTILAEIESLPLSWAGNFIGPNSGTLSEGALLSAFYLFLLNKTLA